ncbi:hypothetical protein CXF77_09455 [Planococcus sp. MB-3u-09]|nr:hypothetical protein CW734_17975 [Planococcus sp. MB-3u-03]PKG46369.1 hypothetical protein CXF66_08285 [Planococcus sp. Urea-trap-24]PKG90155.1 hypothetical protein CXF91_04630 [Planococcus sp. Urea-3u-39]PKH39491.1 hypothetical protein CXF77_09455 [Planococcus sp. MB-3u-09]
MKIAFSLIQMIRATNHDVFPHFPSSGQKKFSSHLKLETEWKGADACGTMRAGETNVARPLRHVGSTPAPRQAAPCNAVEKRKLF